MGTLYNIWVWLFWINGNSQDLVLHHIKDILFVLFHGDLATRAHKLGAKQTSACGKQEFTKFIWIYRTITYQTLNGDGEKNQSLEK